jgi:hypothetical protein
MRPSPLTAAPACRLCAIAVLSIRKNCREARGVQWLGRSASCALNTGLSSGAGGTAGGIRGSPIWGRNGTYTKDQKSAHTERQREVDLDAKISRPEPLQLVGLQLAALLLVPVHCSGIKATVPWIDVEGSWCSACGCSSEDLLEARRAQRRCHRSPTCR